MMGTRWFIPVLPIALCLLGCSSRLASPSAQSLQSLISQPNQFTAANTHITFVGSALLASHEGTFNQLSGKLLCPDGDPSHAHFAVEIDMNSVYTEIPLLTRHLKQPDFFNSDQFPESSFLSTRIQPIAASPGNVQITGDLTLHGVKRSISFPAMFQIRSGTVVIQAKFIILQSDFAMQSVRTTTDAVPVTIDAEISCAIPTTGQSDPAR